MKKKIVLAYSNTLNNSIIIKWLQKKNFFEIITFTANIGQNKEFLNIQKKLKINEIKFIFIKNLQEEFIKNYLFSVIKSNPRFNDFYLFKSIINSLIIKEVMKLSFFFKTNYIAHGAKLKSNTFLQYELGLKYFNSNIKIINPWKSWKLNSKLNFINFCYENNIFVNKNKNGLNNKNLLYYSYNLNNLKYKNDKNIYYNINESFNVFDNTINYPIYITLTFKNGDIVKINNKFYSPKHILLKLNKIGNLTGLGKFTNLENNFFNIKKHFETPGITIILYARKYLELLILNKNILSLKNIIENNFQDLILQGLWWSSERFFLQNIINYLQKNINGIIKLKIFKGHINVIYINSFNSIYDKKKISFEKINEIFENFN